MLSCILICSLQLALRQLEIERREPTNGNLPSTWNAKTSFPSADVSRAPLRFNLCHNKFDPMVGVAMRHTTLGGMPHCFKLNWRSARGRMTSTKHKSNKKKEKKNRTGIWFGSWALWMHSGTCPAHTLTPFAAIVCSQFAHTDTYKQTRCLHSFAIWL